MFTENQKKRIKEVFENYTFLNNNISINDILEIDFTDLDDFNECLNDHINNEEVIYYHVAMNFLNEHDISLRESLNIAEEYGCSLTNLSSEILATLLLQKYLHDETAELIEEIETILEEEEEKEEEN
jgi:hypothetical protein